MIRHAGKYIIKYVNASLYPTLRSLLVDGRALECSDSEMNVSQGLGSASCLDEPDML